MKFKVKTATDGTSTVAAAITTPPSTSTIKDLRYYLMKWIEAEGTV
jgi:hypothetical protein